MKTTISQEEFVQQFLEIRRNSFSAPALRAMFEYYEGLEAATDSELEFNPAAMCCEWVELTEEKVEQQYGKSIVNLEEATTVIKVERHRYEKGGYRKFYTYLIKIN